jgi:hypothetical protein
MPVVQLLAHYINSSKGCPSITESFPLCFLLVLCTTVAALPVVEPHSKPLQSGQSELPPDTPLHYVQHC